MTWHELDLSADKREHEQLVANVFVTHLPNDEKAVPDIIGLPTSEVLFQLEESDHDFLLAGKSQQWEMQLV